MLQIKFPTENLAVKMKNNSVCISGIMAHANVDYCHRTGDSHQHRKHRIRSENYDCNRNIQQTQQIII